MRISAASSAGADQGCQLVRFNSKNGRLTAAIEQYLAALRQKNASPNTVLAYRKDLGKLAAYAQQTSVDEPGAIDHIWIRGFLAHLYETGLSKTSVARALAALRSLYRWLGREGRAKHNPAALVARPRRQKNFPRGPPIEEVNALFRRKHDAEWPGFPERHGRI